MRAGVCRGAPRSTKHRVRAHAHGETVRLLHMRADHRFAFDFPRFPRFGGRIAAAFTAMRWLRRLARPYGRARRRAPKEAPGAPRARVSRRAFATGSSPAPPRRGRHRTARTMLSAVVGRRSAARRRGGFAATARAPQRRQRGPAPLSHTGLANQRPIDIARRSRDRRRPKRSRDPRSSGADRRVSRLARGVLAAGTPERSDVDEHLRRCDDWDATTRGHWSALEPPRRRARSGGAAP